MLPMIIDRSFLRRLFHDVTTSPGARIRIGLPRRGIAGGTAKHYRAFRVGTCGGRYLVGNLSSVSFLIRGGSGVTRFRGHQTNLWNDPIRMGTCRPSRGEGGKCRPTQQ